MDFVSLNDFLMHLSSVLGIDLSKDDTTDSVGVGLYTLRDKIIQEYGDSEYITTSGVDNITETSTMEDIYNTLFI